MPNKVISSGYIGHYSGPETALRLHIYVNEGTFATTDNETVVSGGDFSTLYRTVPCSVGSGCDDDETDIITYATHELDSTDDSFPSTRTYRYVLFDTSGNKIRTVYDQIVVPHDITSPTTLATLAFLSPNCENQVSLPNTYLTATQTQALIDAKASLANTATDSILGAVKLSYTASGGDPGRAVGANDPVYRGLNKSKYTENYTSVQDAYDQLHTITDPIELIWTCPLTHAAATTVTFPANITHRFQASALLTVSHASGKVVFNGQVDAPCRQIFAVSSGKVYVINGRLQLEWWTGTPTDTTDYSAQLTQAIESQHQTGLFGGTIYVGKGVWYVKNIRRRPYTHIKGVAPSIDMGAGGNPVEGTVFALAGGGDYVFLMRAEPIAGGVAHDDTVPHVIGMQDCGITIGSSTTAHCVLVNGPLGQGLYDGYFQNVCFQGLHDAADLDSGVVLVKYDTDGDDQGLEVIGQRFENCWAEVPAYGHWVMSDSSNTSFTFTNCHPVCGIGAWAIKYTGAGWVDWNNGDARGAGGSYGSMTNVAWRTVSSATLTQYTGMLPNAPNFTLMTITSGDSAEYFTSSDIGKKCNFSGFIDSYIISIIDSTHAVLSWHPTSYTGFTNVACTMYRFSDQPNLAGGVIYADGIFQNITMRNGVEEGFNYVAKIRGAPYYGSFNFDGYTGQGKVELMGSCQVFSEHSYWNSLAWRDRANELHPGEQAIVHIDDRYAHQNTVHYGVTVLEGTLWEMRDGVRVVEQSYVKPQIYNFDGGGAPLIGFNTRKSLQDDGLSISTWNSFRAKTDPLLWIGSPFYSQDPDKTLSQIILQLGPADPSNPAIPWAGYQYQFLHHTYSGWLHLMGQQTGFTALALDVDLQALADMYLAATKTFFALGDVKGSKKLVGISKADKAHGIGYGTGAGSSVTQATNRNTAVTINAQCGEITTTSDTLTNGTAATFKVNNSCMGQHDVPEITLEYSGSPSSAIRAEVYYPTGGRDGSFYITYRNTSGADEGSPYLIKFLIKKSVVT